MLYHFPPEQVQQLVCDRNPFLSFCSLDNRRMDSSWLTVLPTDVHWKLTDNRVLEDANALQINWLHGGLREFHGFSVDVDGGWCHCAVYLRSCLFFQERRISPAHHLNAHTLASCAETKWRWTSAPNLFFVVTTRVILHSYQSDTFEYYKCEVFYIM